MRVSDDRYARDLKRMSLALRLIRLEARTRTIHQWTGLSDDRIRKLYKSYCADGTIADLARHRGKSPRQAAFFFKNSDFGFESAQLASLFLMWGLVAGGSAGMRPGFSVGSLQAGATLCSAYEIYRQFHSPTLISFEHAWFLLLALSKRIEIGMTKCSACGGVRLHDLLSKRRSVCSHCGAWADPPPDGGAIAPTGRTRLALPC